MNRRTALIATLALGALLSPLAAEAQQPTKVPTIGMLIPNPPADAATNIKAFRQGLRELGYVEGQNVAIEYRFAAGRDELLAGLAAELVRLNVDVIVTQGTPAARTAKNATKTIPIVTATLIDPVGSGVVASLARPGGNLTGVTSGGAELSGKGLELLRELVPRVTRIAFLWNPANPIEPVLFRETQVAAQALGLQLRSVGVPDPSELDTAFTVITRERPGALLVTPDNMLFAHRKRIVDFAAKNRLPAMYQRRAWVDAGGLMSYGVSLPGNFRRTATFVVKILKGAKPADLPVEDPTRYELVINLKTAKALGLTIPQSVLIRADEVIQ